MGKLKNIETKAEFDELLKSEKRLIVVDFFADWCGPCKMIGPKIEAMEKEMPDVCFVQVNVDDNSETAEECGISAMPTFKLYKNGEMVAEVVGASEQKIRDAIKSNM